MASLQRKSLIATAAIFCCRFTGLLREITYTALFGATGALDAFLTAFRVPNMLRDMFAEGALSQSFTSMMSKEEQTNGPDAAWNLAHRVVSQLVSLMLVVVVAGVLLAGICMQFLYPERAVLQTELREPTALLAPQQEVMAEYRGMVCGEVGLRKACVVLEAPLSGLSEQSSVRVDALSSLRSGDRVKLTTSRSDRKEGTLRVEPRTFPDLAVDLCRIMWPFILLASLSALSMGALNVFGIFGLPNLASAAFNLTTIAVGIAVGWCIDSSFGPDALYGFGIAVLCGGVAQIGVQLPKLRKLGYRPHWDIGLSWQGGRLRFTDPRVRAVWALMIPGAIAAGITQLNVFINTSFALYLPAGAVSALSCAFHLWQLPVALFGVAVGMVVLPTVSRLSLTSAGSGEIPTRLAEALRFVAFFALPSAVLLGLWGEEIVSIFFQRGRFDAQASALCGSVLSAYSLGLLGYAGMKVLQPVFMALEKPWAPAGLALVAFVFSLGLNYTFVRVLGLGATWLALTTAFVTTLNFLFFFFYLRHLLGSMASGVLLGGLVRIAGAGLVLAVFCRLVQSYFFEGFSSFDFWKRFGMMAFAVCGAGMVYVVSAVILRVPELTALFSKIRGRLGR